MLWIYLAVIIIVGLLAFLIVWKLKFQPIIATLLILVAIIVSLWLTGKYVAPHYEVYNLEETIKAASPMYELLAKDSPQEYKEFIEHVKQEFIATGKISDIDVASAKFVNSVLLKHVPTASNSSIYNYLELEYKVDLKLFEENPVFVLAMEAGELSPNLPIQELLKSKVIAEYRQELINAKMEIIKSSINNPTTLTVEEQNRGKKLLMDVFDFLFKQYGKDNVVTVISDPGSEKVDKKTGAKIYLDLYKQMLDKGTNDAAIIMKVITEEALKKR